ncbi:MAG TPA: thioredoxin [Gammaproteobacteria bacterium]|nr:thioredoxin [Gammaproteobacteria bacterium]
MRFRLILFVLLFGSVLASVPCSRAAEAPDDDFSFDDTPLSEVIVHPDWFKESFLDLQDDLQEAVDDGKVGIIVYFGQQRCPYCKKLMDVGFSQPDIVEYIKRHFDVIAIDIWSPEEVTLPDGRTMSQRDYALALNTNFTPSLVFYDRDGRIALRLRGYYPPYQLRAALEYVADGHYLKERFPDYLARGDETLHFEPGDLIEEPFFDKPPYNLDRSKYPADMPLVVFFEQGDCHACDVLHTEPLRRDVVLKALEPFQAVQLDMWADTPLVTPQGEATTAREWARKLGLFYAPTLIFFDEHGREIIRIDSVVQFVRLRNVLNYVASKGYLEEPNFLRWTARTRKLLLDGASPEQDEAAEGSATDAQSQKRER